MPPRFLRYSMLGAIRHRIWELRHDACKKCHGETKEDPCICGVEPCKNCGEENEHISLNEWGCERCVEPEYPRTIYLDSASYYIQVCCPYCNIVQFVKGHDRGHHPEADVLECGQCSKRAWLGEDTKWNSDTSIDESYSVEKGHLSLGVSNGNED